MLLHLPVVHAAPAQQPGQQPGLLQIRWHRKKALAGGSAPACHRVETAPHEHLDALSDTVSPPLSERKVRAGATESRWVLRALIKAPHPAAGCPGGDDVAGDGQMQPHSGVFGAFRGETSQLGCPLRYTHHRRIRDPAARTHDTVPFSPRIPEGARSLSSFTTRACPLRQPTQPSTFRRGSSAARLDIRPA